MTDVAVLGGGVASGVVVDASADPVVVPECGLEVLCGFTQEDLQARLSYDPETGVFMWKDVPENSGKVRGKLAGCVYPDGYVSITIFGKARKAHRLAFLYMTGEMPEHEVDHINKVTTDNRWLNLRKAEKYENQQNRPIRCDNKSGHTGVSYHKSSGKWAATIGFGKRQKHLGIFRTIDAAAAARAAAKQQLHRFNPTDVGCHRD